MRVCCRERVNECLRKKEGEIERDKKRESVCVCCVRKSECVFKKERERVSVCVCV